MGQPDHCCKYSGFSLKEINTIEKVKNWGEVFSSKPLETLN